MTHYRLQGETLEERIERIEQILSIEPEHCLMDSYDSDEGCYLAGNDGHLGCKPPKEPLF